MRFIPDGDDPSATPESGLDTVNCFMTIKESRPYVERHINNVIRLCLNEPIAHLTIIIYPEITVYQRIKDITNTKKAPTGGALLLFYLASAN